LRTELQIGGGVFTKSRKYPSLVLAIIFCLALLFASSTVAQDLSSINAQFRNWLSGDLWPQAQQRGISPKTFNDAFSGVAPNLELPDLIIPGAPKKVPKQQRQAEFRSPSDYFAENVVLGVVNGGQARFAKFPAMLRNIESRTGVPGRIVLAIWGRESAFGNAKIPYNAFEVLGTKAFMSTRKDYFRGEVLAALEMVEKRGVSPKALRGSWAGALGQPQFMPSSYLAYAGDYDGDKIADIWQSVPDTLGSIGAYLQAKGWVTGRDWGFEVHLPRDLPCDLEGPDQGRKISEWVKMGIERVSGRPFPDRELNDEGYLMLPAGLNGPAFIVTPNFYVLKEYNKSDLYALFVGHAADRIEYGGTPFSGQWLNVPAMYRSDVAAMQRGLEKLGYDVGGADGLPGFKTRRSIGNWQSRNRMPQTCFPSPDLVKRLAN
jgi:lytic murein transglycosylase